MYDVVIHVTFEMLGYCLENDSILPMSKTSYIIITYDNIGSLHDLYTVPMKLLIVYGTVLLYEINCAIYGNES